MSRPRRLGAKVLKAVSSSLRLQVLSMLFDRGPLAYTEIMNILHLNPSRDAGRFAYHLKFLLRADLIEPDPETKKYRLTDLGRMLVEVAETIEEHSFKRRKMLVRSSRLAMEEFDRNRIAEALVKEANVPHDLAQKIARETEGRLLEVKTKYLTAPLIREFVNAILIEKGLEEYRHKLTRLGLPVYDVTQLIRSAGAKAASVNTVHEAAGDSVIEEYTLLNALPRDIADAHLSGSLHLNNLGVWILKPNEFAHDLSFILKHGIQTSRNQPGTATSTPPKSLEAALATTSNLLRTTTAETSGEQLLDYFNIYLAPFIRGTDTERIRENLRLFVLNSNQTVPTLDTALPVSLGIELTVPNFLQEKEAAGPSGKKAGHYSDFTKESLLLAQLLLETIAEESQHAPIFQPSLIVKLRPEAMKSKEAEHVLHLAHRLAAEKGLPYFANLTGKEQSHVSYMATGTRFSADWRGDWEIDTVRMGTMDSVIVNLPRIAYESEQKLSRFNTLLDEQLEMALRAMEIKHQTIKLRARENLLPFLTHKSAGEPYARLENFTRPIGFIGLNEAVESMTGKSIHEDNTALALAEQITTYIQDTVKKNARKPESRPLPAMMPAAAAAKRLAQLDIEHYGWAKAKVKGTKDLPHYTDLAAVPTQAKINLNERIKIEEKIQRLTPGGHLAVLQVEEDQQDSAKLLALSRTLTSETKIGLYTFSRSFAYCSRCNKTFPDQPAKCPSCGSVTSTTSYRRLSAKYAPVVS